MLFKKNKPQAQPETAPAQPVATPKASENASPAKPVYQKPVLRRYDQIDQVKPYGPSEI